MPFLQLLDLCGEAIEEVRTLYVRDLICMASIGAYASEVGRLQKIAVSVAVNVRVANRPSVDSLDSVLDYGLLRSAVLNLTEGRHIVLQETLAEGIAQVCIDMPTVLAVYVRIGKLEAFPDCKAVGCELLRRRPKESSRTVPQ